MSLDFQQTRDSLAREFLADEDAKKYLLRHSLAADEAVLRIIKKNHLSDRLAVIAIGGYGRQQLFPFSDLDLLFLLPDDVLDNELKKVEAALGDLWGLGLVVGHSVRKLDECLEQAEGDITAQTAMLESRLLWGSKELFQTYEKAFSDNLNPKDFFRAKLIEQQQRHLKFGEGPYSLEPNIKESAGGLRDLNILAWLIKASGLGDSWKKAHENGLLTQHEADLLEMVTDALYRLRIHMHLSSKRHEDRLLFEVQLALAKELKISKSIGREPSDILMQRYFLNAKSIVQLNTIILQAIKERFIPEATASFQKVNDYFRVSGDILDINDENTFKRYPQAILQAFLYQLDHPQVSKKSTRLLRELMAAHALMGQSFRDDPVNKETFLKIIKSKSGTYHTLMAMNSLGILGRFLPPFRRIVGQMQHDLFHAYTVDQHTLLAIRNLRHFTKIENAHEMPLCTELMMTVKDNWRLVLALLFHDIGKGRGGDHSTIGAEEVKEFTRQFGLKTEDSEYIEFLVREHLTMSNVAQKQDIADPQVVTDFAKKVGTMERLMGLYLITVCDIRATSPSVWTSWKGQLLEDLFRSTAKVLKGRGMSRAMIVERRRRDALARCKFNPEETQKINEFWNKLDVAYFMRHSIRDIVWHAKNILPHLGNHNTLVASRDIATMPNNHFIMVLTKDKPELFARIVSCMQSFGLSILEARIHTGKDDWVLDTFIVTQEEGSQEQENFFEIFRDSLKDRIDSDKPLTATPKGRLSRRSKSFPITPEVRLRPDAYGKQYLLTVVATDRRGLLASIAQIFVRFNINLLTARIGTLGERVEDVFLIEGRILEKAAETTAFEKSLLDALDP